MKIARLGRRHASGGRVLRRLLAVATTRVAVLSTMITADSASAETIGDKWATVCGARGDFMTVDGQLQTKYIIDRDGDKDGHHSGCWGISVNGKIFWTGPVNPHWQEIGGNGRAEYVGHTYLHSDGGRDLQAISVKSAGTHIYYMQYWEPGHGWNGTWTQFAY